MQSARRQHPQRQRRHAVGCGCSRAIQLRVSCSMSTSTHVVREALATAEEAARAQGQELGVELEYKIRSKGRFWEEQSGGSIIGISLNLPLLLLADDLVAMASTARGPALFIQLQLQFSTRLPSDL